MLDDFSFLRSIRENPADDGPRLVYADWLEENGQTIKAEFIRIQCDLARLKPRQRGRGPLSRRLQHLLKHHWRGLFGELAGLIRERLDGTLEQRAETYGRYRRVRGIDVEIKRGFIDAIEISVTDFARYGAALLRQSVVDHLCILGAYNHFGVQPNRSRVGRLLRDELPMARPRSFELSNCGLSLSSYRQLLAGAGFSRTQRLWFTNSRIGDEELALLARSRQLGKLGELSLQSNSFGDAGLRSLSESPYLNSLVLLRINDNWHYDGYSLAGLIELAESTRLPRLARIMVDGRITESQVDFFHRRYGARIQLDREADSDIPF